MYQLCTQLVTLRGFEDCCPLASTVDLFVDGQKFSLHQKKLVTMKITETCEEKCSAPTPSWVKENCVAPPSLHEAWSYETFPKGYGRSKDSTQMCAE